MTDTNIIDKLLSQLPMIMMVMSRGDDPTYILSIMVMMIISYLLFNIVPFVKKIIDYIRFRKMVSFNYTKRSDTFVHDGDIYKEITNFLVQFKSDSIRYAKITGIDYISDKNIITNKIKKILYGPSKYYYYNMKMTDDFFEKMKSTGYNIQSTVNIEELIGNNIIIIMGEKEEIVNNDNDRNRNRNDKVTESSVTFYAKNNSIIKIFLSIVLDFSDFDNRNNKDNLCIFKYYNNNDNRMDCITSNICVKKSFDNIFMSETNLNLVTKKINNWKNNIIKNSAKGLPNKLCFLLTGPPGCGKTSLIYALSTELKKHITSIDLDKMTNETFFRGISFIRSKIIIFDDIDSYDFLHRRSKFNNDDTIESNSEKDLLKIVDAISNNNSKSSDKDYYKKDKITLNSFLEALDCYNNFNDCIIIMTTNHPELLDPAVIRPGRVDLSLEFTYCDQYQFKNIFEYYTEKKLDDYNPYFIIKKDKYTVSHIVNNVVIPNEDSPEKIFELIESQDIIQLDTIN